LQVHWGSGDSASTRPVKLGTPILTLSEAELIGAFIQRIGELRPQMITFNGHSFDLPVLRYRAMANRVSGAGLQVRPISIVIPKTRSTCAMFSAHTAPAERGAGRRFCPHP
jgi:hypothetical protein